MGAARRLASAAAGLCAGSSCASSSSSSGSSSRAPTDAVVIDDPLTKDATRIIWGNASSRLGFLTSASASPPSRATDDDESQSDSASADGPLPSIPNVLAVEWISHVQFSPPLIAVSLVDGFHSTALVRASGEFGLCFASVGQRELASAVGTVSGANLDKFAEIPQLLLNQQQQQRQQRQQQQQQAEGGDGSTRGAGAGVAGAGLFEGGHRISAPMLLGGVMSCECIVRKTLQLDASTIYVGEVVYAKVWEDRMPLGYHQGMTYRYGDVIPDSLDPDSEQ
jgi:flavin reductase (DIM6/NTAB) family NADH-FMN oxidoreductase RutF